MYLTVTIDQGNSCAKVTLFSGATAVGTARFDDLQIEDIAELLGENCLQSVIYSTVGRFDIRLVESLRQLNEGAVVAFTHSTPLPLSLSGYPAPGLDRIAAAAGASALFPGEAVMIADAGTALTLDIVDSEGNFQGGNISAGAKLRLKALHEYTDRLPAIEKSGDCPEFGYDTETAIRAGALRGLAAEISVAAAHAAALYGCRRILLTGGDADLVEAYIDLPEGFTLHREPILVAIGLKRILDYCESAAADAEQEGNDESGATEN